MPGIVGIVDFSQVRPSIDKPVRRMVRILNHTSPSGEEVYVGEHAGFGTVRLNVYPFHDLVAKDANTAIAFWGYLWDWEDLRKKTGFHFANIKDVSITKLLLTLYRKQGIDGLQNLNGRFVIALWDKLSKTLKLVNDRYGFCKLYYWASPDRILFASEYKAIIWHPEFRKKVDVQGLADFMTLGYSTEDRTFFENVKLLPAASVATFSDKKNLAIDKYWDYSFYNENDPLWTEDDYVDQFATILTEATQRQIDPDNKIALPLSGGLDSRTLAAMLHRLDFEGEVLPFSFGHAYAYDVLYGRKIAKNLGFDHTHIPIQHTYIRDHAEMFVWLLEGTVNCLNAHMLLTYPFIRDNSSDTVMTGFFGDIICGSAAWIYSVGLHGSIHDETIFRRQYEVHADIMKDQDLGVFLKPDIYDKVTGRTYDILKSQYLDCPSKHRYFRSRYFSTHQRQRRYTSFNLYIFDFVAQVASPFLDLDFVDFAYHIPPPLAIYQNCYRKMIIKHLPKVASAPHNETKLPLNASRIRQGLHWRWEGWARNPVIRATIGRHYAKMNDNYLNTQEAIRKGSRDFVEKSIRNSEFLADLFNMERVHKLLDDHLSGQAHEPTKITALLTFSLWGRLFIDNEEPQFEGDCGEKSPSANRPDA